jgi:hypothetical protein
VAIKAGAEQIGKAAASLSLALMSLAGKESGRVSFS